VEDDASDVWILVDEGGEELPWHVGFGFELLVGARAGCAEEVAAVGGLEIEADRLVLSDRVELRFGFLEVAAHAVLLFFGLLGCWAELVCFLDEIFRRKNRKECAHMGSLADDGWTNRVRWIGQRLKNNWRMTAARTAA